MTTNYVVPNVIVRSPTSLIPFSILYHPQHIPSTDTISAPRREYFVFFLHRLQPLRQKPQSVATSVSRQPDPYYGHEQISRFCAKFIAHLFTHPEIPPSSSGLTVKLLYFIAYALHHTELRLSEHGTDTVCDSMVIGLYSFRLNRIHTQVFITRVDRLRVHRQ